MHLAAERRRLADRAAGNALAVVEPGEPSDYTDLTAVVDAFCADGFTEDYHVAEEGGVICSGSGKELRPQDLDVVRFRRLEGASDPADMTLVAAVRTKDGAGDGVLVVKYGPDASPGEAELLLAWQDTLAEAENS